MNDWVASTTTTWSLCSEGPFGEDAGTVPNNPNPYRYTSRWRETGDLYYYRARYYTPEVGRFLSRDDARFSDQRTQALHRFLYTEGNPILLVDPTGRAAVGGGDGEVTKCWDPDTHEWEDCDDPGCNCPSHIWATCPQCPSGAHGEYHPETLLVPLLSCYPNCFYADPCQFCGEGTNPTGNPDDGDGGGGSPPQKYCSCPAGWAAAAELTTPYSDYTNPVVADLLGNGFSWGQCFRATCNDSAVNGTPCTSNADCGCFYNCDCQPRASSVKTIPATVNLDGVCR